jgi:ribonuclease HI
VPSVASKSRQIKNKSLTGNRAYSDGSLLANSDGSRVGAGVVILKHNRQHLTISQRLKDNNTVFQAELHAMKAAALYLTDKAAHEDYVHIMVDS